MKQPIVSPLRQHFGGESEIVSPLGSLESETFPWLEALKNDSVWKDDAIDLTIGSPDGTPEQEIIEALITHVRRPEVHGYGSIPGIRELREHIAVWYRRKYEVELDPAREILPLVGSKRAIIDLAVDLVHPEHTILLPEIAYPIYKVGALIAGGIPYLFPLTGEYLPAFDLLDTAVLRHTDLMFLNYPQNPTGAVADAATFPRAIALAREYGFMLCHDNAYSELAFDGRQNPSLLQYDGAKEVGVELLSFSKTFDMAGWRVACMVGKAEIIDIVRASLMDYSSGVFTPIQFAAAKALELNMDGHISVRQSQKYQRRRDLVLGYLEKLQWEYFKPQGGFFVWSKPPISVDDTQEFVVHLFTMTGVLVAPGIAYGPAGKKFIRFCLVQDETVLREAFQRIQKAGDSLYK